MPPAACPTTVICKSVGVWRGLSCELISRSCGQQAAKADAAQGDGAPQNAAAAKPKPEKKRKVAAAGSAALEELMEDELLPSRPRPMPVIFLSFAHPGPAPSMQEGYGVAGLESPVGVTALQRWPPVAQACSACGADESQQELLGRIPSGIMLVHACTSS